jgi:hypothetical protein
LQELHALGIPLPIGRTTAVTKPRPRRPSPEEVAAAWIQACSDWKSVSGRRCGTGVP